MSAYDAARWSDFALAQLGASAALLGLVFVGLSINLARNHPVDCGCFSTKEAPKTPEERLSAMKVAILRDVGFVVLGVWSLRRASDGRRLARTVDSESAA